MARKKVNVMSDTTLNEILFPVSMVDEENYRTNPEYAKKIVGVINGEEWLLNQCSSLYELIPNEEIFPVIEGIFNDAGVKFSANYSHINYVRFYADYQIFDKRFEYRINGTGDVIRPMFRVQHSYNGLTKYKIVFGYFRLVCTNGLVIPVEEMKSYNLMLVGKHTESIKKSFDTLKEMLEMFSTRGDIVLKAITDKYEMMGGRSVTNVQDRVKEVLAAGNIIAVDNSKFNTVNNIVSRIEAEVNNPTLGYTTVNDWLIYNGVNQYLYDNNVNNMPPEKRMDVDTKILEYMLEHA